MPAFGTGFIGVLQCDHVEKWLAKTHFLVENWPKKFTLSCVKKGMHPFVNYMPYFLTSERISLYHQIVGHTSQGQPDHIERLFFQNIHVKPMIGHHNMQDLTVQGCNKRAMAL